MDSGARAYEPEPFEPTAQSRAYCAGGDDDAIERRITEALRSLSRGEKRALMAGASLGRVEGIWLVRGNARLGIPGFRMIDGPRGVAVAPPHRATAFATASLRGASFDVALEERVGAAIADEARAMGANVLLAPTMNVLRHPRWGRAQETYSEDSWHMGSMSVAFVRGVQSRGVLATLKHFAANSIEDTRHTVDVQMDDRTLREVYLPHFRRAIHEANAASVMTGYNRLQGRYCDLHRGLLTDILRAEWGFQGFVMSDWVLGTHGSVESVRAGLDLEMPQMVEFTALGSAISGGLISEHEIDRSLRRMLRAQWCYGLDQRAYSNVPTERETAAHLALARESARRGIVLLANRTVRGATALPLDAASVRSIVVMGRAATVGNIGDRGSSAVIPSAVVTAAQGLTARAGSAITVHTLAALDASALALVRAADAVVIVTGNLEADEGEGEIAAGDRASMALPEAEVALVRAVSAENPRTVVVLEGGSAITTSEWDTAVGALLWAGYPGAQGGHAIADVLFGDHDPSGRLPFSMPEREADLPAFDNRSERVTYGYLQGYRHLQAARTAPRYAFGFGLSYSSVAYESVSLASSTVAIDGTIEARVTVRNTGARPARETAQLYVAAVGSTIVRAPMDLRAFDQREIAGGASAELTLRVPVRELAVWDEAARVMRVEAGTYELRVGPSSEDTPLRAMITVR
jgi:beta-glucosidase